jgi:Uma2 family endonuclease
MPVMQPQSPVRPMMPVPRPEPPAVPVPTVHRWTRDEFYMLGELGVIPEKRVELMNGEIIHMPPIGTGHATVVTIVRRLLERSIPGHFARDQQPIIADDFSELLPDIALLAGDPLEYLDHHPDKPLLVVEVADSSLAYDRTRKASRYAASGIADYWIVNLVDRQLEVYRDPQPMADKEFGHGYASRTIVPVDGQVSPLVAPQVVLAVKDMLP